MIIRTKTLLPTLAGLVMAGTVALGAINVLEFDPDGLGNDEAVELDSVLTLDDDFTVEYWFNTTDNRWRVINSSDSFNYAIWHDDSSTVTLDVPREHIDLNESFDSGAWEHVAVARGGNTTRVFRNGKEVGSIDVWDGEIRLDRIGGTSGGTGWDAYTGFVAEVRVWDHARDTDEILSFLNYRLTGEESGLLGYWPMDEGSGNQVFDATANASTGTVHNATWTTTTDLSFSEALPAGIEPALAFALADLETGSARFTNSNEVELVDLPIPDGYDQFQFTEDGDPQSLGAWNSTSAVPATVEFDTPSADAEITFYAWFTNTSDSVALRRAEQSIVYTETPPDLAPLSALTLETPGFSVRITGADLLGDTTGGTALGEMMDIYSLAAIWEGGDDPDLTPDDPFVTLTNAGVYAVRLRVVNEAGNVAESTASTVTLQAPAKPIPEGDRYVVAHNLNAMAPYTNWITAAESIQTAVNATTANGETILVWPGRYTVPTNAVSGDGALNVANITRPLTMRSVAGKAHTLIDGEGANRGLRINYSQASPPFVLDGFTVTNAFAPNGGGVIYTSGDNETHYLNSLFVANAAEDSGGAMRDSSGSTIVISNSVFRQNHALHDTGNNRGGGAIYKTSGSIAIYDSLFEGNRANTGTHTRGGAISIAGGTIERTIFRDNRSHLDGNAGSGGGAIYTGTHLVLRNSLFHDNAGHRGGAIMLPNSDRNLTIENCTITRNHSGGTHTATSAGGIWNRAGAWNIYIYNSIVIGNTGGPNLNYGSSGVVTELLHSCTSPKTIHPDDDAGFDADGNITDDPLFADPDTGDFRLSRESPCINTGTNMPWMVGATDLDGNRRIDGIHNQVDMGAYEYQYPATIILIR